MAESVTVLHLSDTQFGDKNLFGGAEEFLLRLTDDLTKLRSEPGLRPDLLVVTGDLAEYALPAEFSQVTTALTGLAEFLNLPRSRVVVVPGNHDVSWRGCRAHFENSAADGEDPVPPYWPKWRQYLGFFQDFYRDEPGIGFQIDQEWSLFAMPELKVVVAGLNSTMAETHEHHWGEVGERQCRWFERELTPYEAGGWLRIGAVHHNVIGQAGIDTENLRDRDVLDRYLGDRLDLLLHGHTHSGGLDRLGSGLPVLSTGSAAVDGRARYDEEPNQYQLLALGPGEIVRYGRSYDRRRRRWIGDNRIDRAGNSWIVRLPWQPRHRWARTDPPPRPPEDPGQRPVFRVVELIDRVAEVTRLRNPGASVVAAESADGEPYLRVTGSDGRIVTQRPVGVSQYLSDGAIDRFEAVHRSYAAADPTLTSELVHGGPADPELARAAYPRGIRVLSFAEYQGLMDLSAHVAAQTARLVADPVYPPALYVPQRFRMLEGIDREPRHDALAGVLDWLASDQPRFVLLLGDFGRGKTFLLHELARRLPDELPHVVPLLVELRRLEKARTVEELVAQHLTAAGVDRFDLTAFRYMLRSGRIALLLDGFDELALRVSYDRADDHLRTILAAMDGQAKIVLTSRTQHFLTDDQVRTALGARAELAPGRRLATLEDFTTDQIRDFLVNRFGGDEAAADARLALIQDIEDLLGLSHNPRMLGFIADLPEDRLRAAQARTGAIGSADLYRELIAAWLGHEDARAHPPGAAPGLGSDQRWDAVTSLALIAWRSTDRYVGIAELDEVAAGLVAAAAETTLDPGETAQAVGSGTLLGRTEDGRFAFVHQSVMEWLVAAEAAARLEDEPAPDLLAVREMSVLMADFFCGLAGDDAARWSAAVLADPAAPGLAKDNALLVRHRLGLSTVAPAELAGQALRGADLTDEDLSGAKLDGADLRGARLIRTRLSNADLRGACLADAYLDGVRLDGADLLDADLTGARVRGSDLTGAVISGSRWDYASLVGGTPPADRTPLRHAAVAGQDRADRMLLPTGEMALSLAWSPDGRLLAFAPGKNRVVLVDMVNGKNVRVLSSRADPVQAFVWSPDGTRIATVGDAVLTIWDVRQGRVEKRVVTQNQYVSAVAWSPDGSAVAAAGTGGTVTLRGLDGTVLDRLGSAASSWVRALAWDVSGKLASAGEDGTVRVWNTTDRTVVHLTGHADRVNALAWHPDGRLASAGDDASIMIWTDAEDDPLVLRGHTEAVHSLAWRPGGTTLASGGRDAARIWDPAIRAGTSLPRPIGGTHTLGWSPDGKSLATGGYEDVIRLWNPESGRTTSVDRINRRLYAVSWSPDGSTLATGGSDMIVRMTEAATGRTLDEDTASGQALVVAWSPDGHRLATAGTSETVRVRDLAVGGTTVLTGHEQWVNDLGWNPGGTMLASASSDGTARLWHVGTALATGVLAGHDGGVEGVSWRGDGAVLATSGEDGTVRLWDAVTGAAGLILTGHTAAVSTVRWNPRTEVLATAALDRSVRLWAPRTGESTVVFKDAWARAVAWDPTGTRLAVAVEKGPVRVVDPAGRRPPVTLAGHFDFVESLAWSPGGEHLATASRDGTVRLWDAGTGAEQAVLLGLDDGGWAVLLPDGSYKVEGDVAGRFWWAVKLVRFEVGELDEFVPGIRRLAADAPIPGM